MLKLNAKHCEECNPINNVDLSALNQEQDKNIQATKTLSQNRNNSFFKAESEKIDRYTEDKLFAAEKEIKDVKAKIKSLEREERAEENLERKIALQEEIATLERKKRKLRQEIFDVEDEIEDERKSLIDALKQHLNAKATNQHLFTFKWKLC